MKCDTCFHKQVCKHYDNFKSETYAYMGVGFNPNEDCREYISANIILETDGKWEEQRDD